VVIGSDHTGVALRTYLLTALRGRGLAVVSVGPEGAAPPPADYPDIAEQVGLAVVRREADAGIVIDGAGLGSTMAANKVAGVRAAGASRLGMQASGAPAGSVVGLIDHTLLKPDATQAEIETLCREAREYSFATVCLNPTWVPLAARLLRGSPVGVCTVVGFP